MPAVGVAVEQTDRQRLDALLAQRRQLPANSLRLRHDEHLAVGRDPLVDLDHLGRQRRALRDGQLEQLGPVLVADPQHVGKAPGGDQGRACPAPRDQRVGAPRRAQPHRGRRDLIPQPQPEHVADCHHGRLFAGGQLVRLTLFRRQGQGGPQVQHAALALEPLDGRLGHRPAARVDQAQRVAVPEACRVHAPRRIDDALPVRSRRGGPLGHARAEQLVPQQAPVVHAPDAVGERPANVDPEFHGPSACPQSLEVGSGRD